MQKFAAILSLACLLAPADAITYKTGVSYSFSGNTAGGSTGGTSNVTYSYSGNAAGPNGLSNGTYYSAAGASVGPNGIPWGVDLTPITRNTAYPMMTGTNKVYLIYYGSRKPEFLFFTATARTIVQDFVTGLAATDYYQLIKAYGVGTVAFGSSIYMDCNTDWYNRGCDLSTDNVDDIIYDLMVTARNACVAPGYSCQWGANGLIKDINFAGFPQETNSMYVIMAAPETTEALGNDGSQAHIGQDYCAYHTHLTIGTNKYPYAFITVPNPTSINVASIMDSAVGGIKPASKCFWSRNTSVSPNGNTKLDMSINYLAHEILEMLSSPDARKTWLDSNGKEIMDKCEGWIGGMQRTSNYDWNVAVGARKFLLPAVWDKDRSTCAISTGDVTPPPATPMFYIKSSLVSTSPAYIVQTPSTSSAGSFSFTGYYSSTQDQMKWKWGTAAGKNTLVNVKSSLCLTVATTFSTGSSCGKNSVLQTCDGRLGQGFTFLTGGQFQSEVTLDGVNTWLQIQGANTTAGAAIWNCKGSTTTSGSNTFSTVTI